MSFADATRPVRVHTDGVELDGDLTLPHGATGLVVFAHGSGSSRTSPRNRFVAELLFGAGFATLLIDLLTQREEQVDRLTGTYRFDIHLLARRLDGIVDWASARADLDLPIGLFGASTGAAAALQAAGSRHDLVRAVVSRGGRPDLAGRWLERVRCPVLCIVGSRDPEVLALNEQALGEMTCERRLEIVQGATHLFEEPGALDEAAGLTRDWFKRYLAPEQYPHVQEIPGHYPA